jgi:hypothetical protein
MALPFRLLLVVAVAALGVGVLLVASGGLGRVATAVGSTFAGFVSDITSTPAPSAAEETVADAPVLDAPPESYTNQPSVDLVGTVPADIAGNTDDRIRIYVALGNGASAPITELPVGASQHFLVPDLKLSEGTNTFQATIVGADDRESERSAAVSYILDTSKPRITVKSPKNNATVNAKTVQIAGQTQPRSALSARNTTTNATVNGSADGAGAFTIVVPLGDGTNTIQLTATDPAGNVNTAKMTLRHGTGVLTAHLTASTYRIRASRLPEPVTLTVIVNDPDGRALAGAAVTFTLAVPGEPAIASSEIKTSSTGRASFTTTIPKGSTKGEIQIAALIDTPADGHTTETSVIKLN